uniref:NADH-ubiquinone oxidoreductase chain 3 n=1 Tax=Heterodoxus spiniger TaxID=762516 RepID=A0A7T1HEZ6_9NEOP|nr:NADH dehydrogenase subunit 3 [Heterodoxus spiniger]
MLMILLLSSLIILILYYLSVLFMDNKNILEDGKKEFECGFRAENMSRLPFSMQFFSIALVFLIFDVELIIILPYVFNFTHVWMFSMMMILLYLGTLLEWMEGSLDWYY